MQSALYCICQTFKLRANLVFFRTSCQYLIVHFVMELHCGNVIKYVQ